MRLLTAFFIAALLAACATAVGTAYGPADDSGYGYRETRVEADRFRIVFAGDGATPQEVVEDYALLRAAELAVENGYDWFRVVAGATNAEDKGGVGIGAGFGSGSVGRRSAVGVGVGGNLGTVGARRFFTTRLEVLMGRGALPEGEEVYDARSVIETVGARTSAAG